MESRTDRKGNSSVVAEQTDSGSDLLDTTAPSVEVIDRRKFLGGSDMAAVLSVSPWKTPYMVWLEKTGQHVEEIDPVRQKYFRRGKLMEPVVIQMVREEHGLEIISTNQRYTDKLLPFLSCEIDFEWMDLNGPENADVKTANPRMARYWGEQGSDEIPVYYTVQFLFGQMIRERNRTLCAALIGSDDLRVYRTERDEPMITYIREKAEQFWELVETRTAPPMTSIEDVNLAWPKDSGRVLVATDEIAEMIERHRLLRKSIGGDEAKAELLELDIFKFMGDSTELVDQQGKRLATRKLQERKAYTVQPASFRVFRTAAA